MAIIPSTCPECGGPAHVTTDDGIRWCDNPKCGELTVPNAAYQPPDRRGGS